MKKIQFQFACSVSSPPGSGPIDSASEETPAQMPIAVPRWRGGKVAVMIDSVAGFHQRGAGALHDAATDENGAARREPAGKRGASEDG